MTALWTAADAARATGGQLGGQTGSDWIAHGVSIDTRTLAPGDLFVALTDQRDGHDFVAQALEKGAAAALVSRRPEGVAEDAPLLIVPDVLAALTALGRAGRERMQGTVIGITGSVGKTSTKEMLRAALAGQGRLHAAEASYNNHWGVPLTLARMPADTEIALIEIGMNHPGEIAPLARLAAPQVALVTTVAAAHLAAFPDVSAIAREKGAIFEGLPRGGAALYNADLEVSPILATAAQAAGAIPLGFGQGRDAGARMTGFAEDGEGSRFAAHIDGREIALRMSQPGRHVAMNALAVLAVVAASGRDPERAAAALAAWAAPKGRGAREELVLERGGERLEITLIDDAFNANPASTAAALDLLLGAEPGPGGRRVVALTDMLELGDTAPELHRAIAAHPGFDQIARVHCAGPLMRHLHAALPEGQQGAWAESAEALAPRVIADLRMGDIVLIKGSKGSKASRIVDLVRDSGHRTGASPQGKT